MQIDEIVSVIPPMAVFDTSACHAKYAIFRDAPLDDIIAFAKENPEVFIFPFATKSVEEMHDYSKLRYYPWDLKMNILQRVYVGNLEPIESAIRQYVAAHFVGLKSEEVSSVR
jgi:hypothetical protein